MRSWKRDLADVWIERKAETLKVFMDGHCMGNFWLSQMGVCKVMSLLQSILSNSTDKHKWKLIPCKDILRFLHPFCCCLLLCKMFRNFPGCSILQLFILLWSPLLWQFLLSLLPNLFFLVHIQKRHWHSSSSDWATSGDRLQVFVCSLYTRSWQSMGLFGTSLCSVLAFRPFSCWRRACRSGPWSVTEGVLAAACHVEKQ